MFPILMLDPHKLCLEWLMISSLPSQPIYDPLKSDQKFDFDVNFTIGLSTTKNWNTLLDAIMYPLQIINDIEALSLIFHVINDCFIHNPSISKIANSAISQRLVNQRKGWSELHICTYFCQLMAQNSSIYCYRKWATFFTSANKFKTAQQLYIQNSKKVLCRVNLTDFWCNISIISML